MVVHPFGEWRVRCSFRTDNSSGSSCLGTASLCSAPLVAARVAQVAIPLRQAASSWQWGQRRPGPVSSSTLVPSAPLVALLCWQGRHWRRRLPLLGRRALRSLEEFRVFRSADGQEFELFTDQILGAGAQGTVYAGQALPTGERVAVKVIPTWRLVLDDAGRKKLAAIEEEFETFRALGRHPNIAGMIAGVDVFRNGSTSAFPHYKLMVMEAVEGRELAEHVAVDGPMLESIARHVFLQVLDGLMHVHTRGVIHRDLKPENVLVTGDEVTLNSCVKLIDFGVAKCLRTGPLQTIVGTPTFMAPEVVQAKLNYAPSVRSVGAGSDNRRHTFSWGQPAALAGGQAGHGVVQLVEGVERKFCPKIDVWSAGVVLYTCLTGKIPFTSELEIIESDYLRGPLGHCSEEAKDLLAGMLEKDPKKRLSVEECSLHPWIGCSLEDGCTINWDNLPDEVL